MIGFGSWAIGGSNWGPTNQDESIRAIEQALDSGITFFDTAYSYGGGHSEELLAMALASHRQHVVLATKGGIVPGRSKKDFSAAHLRAALEGSLRRLATEYIDLYYLHNPTPEDMTRGECFEALEQFKAEGKVRAWGVSVCPSSTGWYTPPTGAGNPIGDAKLAMKIARPDAIQIVFNVMEQSAAELFDETRRRSVAVISRVPLERGLLSGRFTAETTFPEGDFRQAWPRKQFLEDLQAVERIKDIIETAGLSILEAALAFPLSFPEVAATIPGARNAHQARLNASAAGRVPLDEEIVKQLCAMRKRSPPT
jgi:myo-inositol catabolism protein IolS